MRYDPSTQALIFGSASEAEGFHDQLSALVRAAMVQATRTVEDPQQAKALSREVFREYASVMRALSSLRDVLPRRGV